jgi:hypothetical protein
MMEIYFTDQEMTIPELEEYKWEILMENTLESAIYALYLQNRIDEIMMGVAKEIIEQLKDVNVEI